MKKRTKRLIYIAYLFFLVISAYLFYVGYRSRILFSFVTENYTIMSKGIIEIDPTLGYAPKPASLGYMMYVFPPYIEHCYDFDRNRVAYQSFIKTKTRPFFLTLGGSFTHGDGVMADEVFSSIVAKHFNGTVFNRGFSGYGLAQMLLIARKKYQS